jgi:hypothetical protein
MTAMNRMKTMNASLNLKTKSKFLLIACNAMGNIDATHAKTFPEAYQKLVDSHKEAQEKAQGVRISLYELIEGRYRKLEMREIPMQ